MRSFTFLNGSNSGILERGGAGLEGERQFCVGTVEAHVVPFFATQFHCSPVQAHRALKLASCVVRRRVEVQASCPWPWGS